MSDYRKPIFISRRHFLRTASGGLIAIPLMSSLLPRAFAQSAAPKRFLGITMKNGFHAAYLFPEYTRIMTSRINVNGLDAHVMQLSGLSGPISNIIDTPFDSLRSSMMLLRGFESMVPKLDHNDVFAFSGMSGNALPAIGSRYPSIDQHIKNVVYAGTGSSVPVLSICASFTNSRPSSSFSISPTGSLVRTPNFYEPAAVWQQLFGTMGTGGANEAIKDKLVTDQVIQHYTAVSKNPKLSKEDKLKLDNHLARLSDHQKTLTGGAGCTPPLKPTVVFNQQSATVRQAIAAFIDLIVAAFECDITRVALFEIDPDTLWNTLSPYNTGYHAQSHGNTLAEAQMLSNIAREQFGYVASLWQKLQNSTDVDGNSILYNTLSLVTKEIGDYGGGGRTGNPANDRIRYAGTMAAPSLDNNHDGRGMIALIGGHLGGVLKPGKYIDYTSDIYSPNNRWKPLVGPSYSELLVSVLAAFGVAPGAWELNGKRGYGDFRDSQWGSVTTAIVPKSTDQRSMLPGWT